MVFSEKDRENAKKLVSQCDCGKNQSNNGDGRTPDDNPFLGLNPSELLVIAGLIGGVLEVDSVLVDRDQTVQIILSGSLKRKTQLDMMMEQIGKMPFD